VPAPLSGNISATRTGGEYQYAPATTPSCGPTALNITEPHHCPQRATEAAGQILHFFSTALSGGAPVILDPLP
jgi:hypothetical protein